MAYQNTPQKQYQMMGTINQVMATETIQSKKPGGNPFVKRVVVINDDLGNPIAMEITGQAVTSVDAFQAGTQVNVNYEIKSNFWQAGGKWFTTLKIVSISPVMGVVPQQQPAQVQYGMPPQQQAVAQPATAQPAQPPVVQPAQPAQPPVDGDDDQIPF